MPHEVIVMNIGDIERAPESFQPDEIQIFSISEEYSENSAAPYDDDYDWGNDVIISNSTTDDTNSIASSSNVAGRDVFKSPSPACRKNPPSSENGATHGFFEIASPSGEKPSRKKRSIHDDDGDAALQRSMVTTLDALSSSLRKKTKEGSEEEDKGSKASTHDPVYDELLQYCSNFARRMADIPNAESRERIRHAMEMAMFDNKFK